MANLDYSTFEIIFQVLTTITIAAAFFLSKNKHIQSFNSESTFSDEKKNANNNRITPIILFVFVWFA